MNKKKLKENLDIGGPVEVPSAPSGLDPKIGVPSATAPQATNPITGVKSKASTSLEEPTAPMATDTEDEDFDIKKKELEEEDEDSVEVDLDEEDENTELEDPEMPIDVKEHMDALLDGEDDLNESFKEKARVIFEAAVRKSVKEHTTAIRRQYAKRLFERAIANRNRHIAEAKENESILENKVGKYVDVIVENWKKEHTIELERGIRTELSESFMSRLKNLFEEHYIDVPANKVDLVQTLEEQVTKLETRLNNEIKLNGELNEQVNLSKREAVVQSLREGLTSTQVAKLRDLLENVEYTNRKEFGEKAKQLKESYFTRKSTSATSVPLTEAAINDKPATETVKKPVDRVSQYALALDKLPI